MIKEYIKKSDETRRRHLKFPSGLEFDVEFPYMVEVLDILEKEKLDINNPMSFVKAILKYIERQFPSEKDENGEYKLTLKHLLPQDFDYLVSVVNDFFSILPKSRKV